MLGEDVASDQGGVYGITDGLPARFGLHRVIDTPITESAIVGAAGGAALTGLRPVAELMFVDFLGVCLDQILNQIAKFRYMFGGQARTPVVIRTMIGAGTGTGPQHSQILYPLLAAIPGIKVVTPANATDAKGLLTTAIRDDDPVFMLESERMLALKGEVPEGDHFVPFGKALVRREGADCTVISFGRPVHFCLEAAEELAKEGISCEVIDGRTIRPLDMDTIVTSVKKTNRCVVVDQSWPYGSPGSEIAARVHAACFDDLDNHVMRVHTADVPTPYAWNLEQEYLPNARRIAEAVRSACYVA